MTDDERNHLHFKPRELPDIHDKAGWRRWAKEQSAEAKRRADLATQRNKFLWE